MAEKKDYKYYAFISYNHQDEKIAKKLQYQLEHYKLPSVARKEIDEDVMLYPIFRYVSDLGIAVLRDPVKENRRIVKKIIGEHIKGELEASKYLIVICSPHSAKPNLKGDHWVNDEVRHFVDIGRINYIIPVIVDGKPGDKERECFCPALAEAEIAGVDLQEEKESVCVQKIVAKLLGLMPDMLIQRFRQDQKLRRLKLFFYLILPLILLVVTAGLFVFDSTRLVTKHYADYVDSFGLPEGIFPLNEKQRSGRHASYRFEYCGYQYGASPHADSAGISWFGFRRKLVRIICVSHFGLPRPDYLDRPIRQDFEYDNDNRLIKILQWRNNSGYFDFDQRLEFHNEGGVTNGLVTFFAKQDGQLYWAFSPSTFTSYDSDGFVAKSEISQHLLLRDKNGRIVRRKFLNNSGNCVSDADGIWGVDYEHDDFGRIIEEWYLAPNGELFDRHVNRKGVAGQKFIFRGNMLKRKESVNSEGTPTLNDLGFMVVELSELDEFGNPRHEVYKNAKGYIMYSKYGYAQRRMEYDVHGEIKRMSFYDKHGNLTPVKEGYAECRYEYESNSSGLVERRLCYGVDGKQILCKEGYAESRMEYDEEGRIIRVSFYDCHGGPTLCKEGYAECRYEYKSNSKGTTKRKLYFGVDGKQVLCKEGYAECRYEYNGNGEIIRVTHYDCHGRSTFSKEGYAELRMEYDKRGNLKKRAFYGTNDNLTWCRGYSQTQIEYDKFGNVINQMFLDDSGRLTIREDGVAGCRVNYDGYGHPTNFLYYGVNREPILYKDRYAEVNAVFDMCGNLTNVMFLGVDGKPMLHEDGFAESKLEYDSFGNNIKSSFYSLGGKMGRMNDGVVHILREFDDRGNITKLLYYGVDERLTLNEDGVGECRMKYDEYGNVTNILKYGVDGKLTLNNEDGVAECRMKYDEYGNVTNMSLYGVDGKPTLHRVSGVAGTCVDYDEYGNEAKKSFYGVDGKPTLNKEGCAEIRTKYDAYGNETKVLFYGVDGEPMLRYDGVAEIRTRYDAYGNKTNVLFYGVDGMATLNKEGIAGVISKYDAFGNETFRRFFGIDGKPILHKGGNAGWECEYDEKGHVIREVFLGVDGKPMISSVDGYAERRTEYNARGKPIKTSYHDVCGMPMLSNRGFAEECAEYDAYGNMTNVLFLGTNGCPILGNDGFSGIASQYNDYGKLIKFDYYGVDGKLSLSKDGYARVWLEYDNYGKIKKMSYYDQNGELIMPREIVSSRAIQTNSMAERLGVKEGDIWCRLGDYEMLATQCIDELGNILQDVKNIAKELVVARWSGNGYAIYSFKFPPDTMGIYYEKKVIFDFHKVKEAYELRREN